MDNIQEIWKDVVGYEGFYKVSNLGRLMSTDRITKHWRGGVSCIKGRMLKPSSTLEGYLRATLTLNGVQRTFSVHRIVATAFINNHQNKPQINHKNKIVSDNRVDNLEWATPQENIDHKYMMQNQ